MKKKKVSSAAKEYTTYLNNKKPGEVPMAACKRLGLTYSRVRYYIEKQEKSKSKRAPAPTKKAASTRRKYTRHPKAEVIAIPSDLGDSPRKSQIVMLIGDPETIFNYLGQKGW